MNERKIEQGSLGEIIDWDEKNVMLPQDALLMVPASVLEEYLGRKYPHAPGNRITQVVIGDYVDRPGWGVVYGNMLGRIGIGEAALEYALRFPERGRDPELLAKIPDDEKGMVHLLDDELEAAAEKIVEDMSEEMRKRWDFGIRFLEANYPLWEEEYRRGTTFFSEPGGDWGGP